MDYIRGLPIDTSKNQRGKDRNDKKLKWNFSIRMLEKVDLLYDFLLHL